MACTIAGAPQNYFKPRHCAQYQPNSRGRKGQKRGRKALFIPAIFKERFRTIERVFAWEDKFRRLRLRFERISQLHYALKTLAYTMINLRRYGHS
jgi:transposase